MTHILLAVIGTVIMAEIEIGTGTGTGTTTGATVTVVGGSEVEITAIGIGIGIGITMVVEMKSGYASVDLLAELTLLATETRRWASARVGGGRSQEPEVGIASVSLDQAEIMAHEAHNTKEGIRDNENTQPFISSLIYFYTSIIMTFQESHW
jgi:hypothetical protein